MHQGGEDHQAGGLTALGVNWGATAAERARPFPCDSLLDDPDGMWFRAVDVDAPAAVVFRWLCQLRVAPYSYDWIDNLGRRSPRQLTPGLEELALGQRFMTIFDLVAFSPGEHVTLRTRSHRPFGDVVVTYRVEPRGEGNAASRLLVKILVRWPVHLPGLSTLIGVVYPLADVVMMRRQLLNLERLSESTAAALPTRSPPVH